MEMREARRYLEEHREFHRLAISTSLVSQMVVAHYFLKKPPAKTAKRVPGLRSPAPYLCALCEGFQVAIIVALYCDEKLSTSFL